MKSNSCVLTILTPTYNRRKELQKLYESLNNQTQKGFQWLVIDDGSNDGTDEYITSLPHKGFIIEYHSKPNGGKHTALNYSHPYILGEYICIVDSDDYLVPEAISVICETIDIYKNDEEIACFSFQRGRDSTEPLVKNLPIKPIISNHIDFRLNGNRPGDCCEVERTTAFKEFPFPEFSGEKFMSEGYLWVNMGKKYKTVYINKVIYICEYLSGGLTNSGRKMRVRSPLGGMATSNAFLSAKKDPKLNLKLTIKQTWLYICYGKFAGLSYEKMKRECERPGLMTVNYPVGILMYEVWKRKYC